MSTIPDKKPEKLVPNKKLVMDAILKHRDDLDKYFRLRGEAEDANVGLQEVVNTFNRSVGEKVLVLKSYELIYFYKAAMRGEKYAQVIVKSVCDEYADIANEQKSDAAGKSFGDWLKDDEVIPNETGPDYKGYRDIQRQHFYFVLNSCVGDTKNFKEKTIPAWAK